MRAEIAFGRRVADRVDVEGVVRTGLHTGLAADAAVGIEIDHAVIAAIEGRHRTNGDAGREFTVVAAHHAEHPAVVRKLSLLDVFHPRAIDADWHLMLTLAGHRTRMATDAFAV